MKTKTFAGITLHIASWHEVPGSRKTFSVQQRKQILRAEARKSDYDGYYVTIAVSLKEGEAYGNLTGLVDQKIAKKFNGEDTIELDVASIAWRQLKRNDSDTVITRIVCKPKVTDDDKDAPF